MLMAIMAKQKNKKSFNKVSWLLRIGIASTFLYAAYSAFDNPDLWLGFIPEFVTNAAPVSAKFLLDSFSVFQIGLAIWLLSGKYLKYSGLVAAATLGSIVLLNISSLIIVFRDIPIVLAAVALYYLDDK